MSIYEAIPSVLSVNDFNYKQQYKNIPVKESNPSQNLYTALPLDQFNNQLSLISATYSKSNQQDINDINFFTYDTCYRINYMANNGLINPYLNKNHPTNADPIISKNSFYLFSLQDFIDSLDDIAFE